MDIVCLGPPALALEMNYLIGPYHEFDCASDALELAFRIPYREAALIDLDYPELIIESQENLQKAALVIVLTNCNGDYHRLQEVLEGMNCRFLPKPVTKRGWEQALNPDGKMSLMVPDMTPQKPVLKVVEVAVPLMETPILKEEIPVKRKRGRPKKKVDL